MYRGETGWILEITTLLQKALLIGGHTGPYTSATQKQKGKKKSDKKRKIERATWVTLLPVCNCPLLDYTKMRRLEQARVRS